MRVVLVGSKADRARVRQRLTDPIEAVGEAPTLGAARATNLDADAYLVASIEPADRDPDEAGDVVAEPLTPREIQVLDLLAEGLPNKAIAVRLGVSDQTVKFHVSSICGKLGAVNRTDAVRRGVRRGIITL